MLTALPATPTPTPIPANKEITYIAEGRCVTLFTTFASDVRAAVQATLTARGMTVRSSMIAPKSNERLGDWDYRAEIIARSSSAHARIEDLESIVRGALWEAAGSPPTVTAQGYNSQRTPAGNPGIPTPFGEGGGGLAVFALVALVLVTATGVFVAKRG